MNKILFSIGEFNFTSDHLIGISLVAALSYLVYGLLANWIIPRLVRNKEVEPKSITSVKIQISLLVFLFWLLLIIAFLKSDLILLHTEEYDLKISHVLQGLIIFQLARIIDWVISNLYIHEYYQKRDTQKNNGGEFKSIDQENKANRIVQYIVFVLAILFLLNLFKSDYSLFERTINGEILSFRISNILIAILIYLVAQWIVWIFIQLILYNVYKRRKVEVGAQYAINQLFKYVVYVIAFILVLDNLGLNITILLGGAAALLVGVGLGLQQTFNDFISGLVLLFERTVAVGDVLEVEGIVGIVKKIGLRASTIETRGNITVLVPNSKLVNDKVINWTHFDDKVRFELKVGVAYGSDTEKVRDILIELANSNPYVINYPSPFVRFNNFGDSSLDFTLYFFSRNFIVIEDIKSDMRFDLDKQFREAGITIPFPQREIWTRQVKE